jgi:hypothetical protein
MQPQPQSPVLDSRPPIELSRRVIVKAEATAKEAPSGPPIAVPTPATSASSNQQTAPKPSYESQRRRPKTSRRHILQEWLWELLAWALGTVAISAIIVLLALFKGRLVRDWHSRISINTIVSVLSQAAVSTLLVSVSTCLGQMKLIWYQKKNWLNDSDAFDRASRGAYGSLLFLLRPRRALLVMSLRVTNDI